MSIFATLFGGNQNAQPQPQQNVQQNAQPTPGNIPNQPTQQTQQSQQTAPNGVVPEQKQENASPLDQFKDIWQPTEQDANANQPLMNVDPKSLAEAARRTDFSKMIQPEQLQAIAQGGDAAVQAFAAAMNQVAQGVYAQSAFAATKIAEKMVNTAQERFTNDLPNHVKKLQVADNLRNENPALSHPAAAPILQAVEASLTAKHPNATANEIATMARSYLENFAGMVSPKKPDPTTQAKDKEFDFTSFLS